MSDARYDPDLSAAVQQMGAARPSDQPADQPLLSFSDAINEMARALLEGRNSPLAGVLRDPSGLTISQRKALGQWLAELDAHVNWRGALDGGGAAVSRQLPGGELRVEGGRDPFSGWRAGVSGGVSWGR